MTSSTDSIKTASFDGFTFPTPASKLDVYVLQPWVNDNLLALTRARS